MQISSHTWSLHDTCNSDMKSCSKSNLFEGCRRTDRVKLPTEDCMQQLLLNSRVSQIAHQYMLEKEQRQAPHSIPKAVWTGLPMKRPGISKPSINNIFKPQASAICWQNFEFVEPAFEPILVTTLKETLLQCVPLQRCTPLAEIPSICLDHGMGPEQNRPKEGSHKKVVATKLQGLKPFKQASRLSKWFQYSTGHPGEGRAASKASMGRQSHKQSIHKLARPQAKAAAVGSKHMAASSCFNHMAVDGTQCTYATHKNRDAPAGHPCGRGCCSRDESACRPLASERAPAAETQRA
eukprot:1160149-Pelagomonas_calceolata.AAC.3